MLTVFEIFNSQFYKTKETQTRIQTWPGLSKRVYTVLWCKYRFKRDHNTGNIIFARVISIWNLLNINDNIIMPNKISSMPRSHEHHLPVDKCCKVGIWRLVFIWQSLTCHNVRWCDVFEHIVCSACFYITHKSEVLCIHTVQRSTQC